MHSETHTDTLEERHTSTPRRETCAMGWYAGAWLGMCGACLMAMRPSSKSYEHGRLGLTTQHVQTAVKTQTTDRAVEGGANGLPTNPANSRGFTPWVEPAEAAHAAPLIIGQTFGRYA